MVKPPGRPNLALADFTAPRETGIVDYIGGFAVTAGHRLDVLVADFEAAHDDYSAILARALADRLAEAFAERSTNGPGRPGGLRKGRTSPMRT